MRLNLRFLCTAQELNYPKYEDRIKQFCVCANIDYRLFLCSVGAVSVKDLMNTVFAERTERQVFMMQAMFEIGLNFTYIEGFESQMFSSSERGKALCLAAIGAAFPVPSVIPTGIKSIVLQKRCS